MKCLKENEELEWVYWRKQKQNKKKGDYDDYCLMKFIRFRYRSCIWFGRNVRETWRKFEVENSGDTCRMYHFTWTTKQWFPVNLFVFSIAQEVFALISRPIQSNNGLLHSLIRYLFTLIYNIYIYLLAIRLSNSKTRYRLQHNALGRWRTVKGTIQ